MKHFALATAFAVSLSACTAQTSTDAIPAKPQTITVKSTQTFAATETRLRDALATRQLKLFTVVDHGAGAQSIGENIGASKLFIFGNPKSGTPLMMANPELGLELPMKILLHDADDGVHLHRTDVATTVRAYGVTDQAARLTKISDTLTAIMTEAAQIQPAP